MPMKSKLRLVTPAIGKPSSCPMPAEERRAAGGASTHPGRGRAGDRGREEQPSGRHPDLGRLPAWPTCRRGLQTRNAKLDPDQGAGIARFALVRRLRPAGWEACQARLETGLRAGAELNGAKETDGREQ